MATQVVYVTDTHSLLWHLIDSPKLSVRARAAFDQVATNQATLIVPVIVLAELIYLGQKRRIPFKTEELARRIRENVAIEIAPLSEEVTLAIETLQNVSEMHDRLIVSEAKVRRAKLITRDAEIQNANVVETVW